MRMRRKKNLEQKLVDCGEYLIIPQCTDLKYDSDEDLSMSYEEIFGNSNPVVLEIGAGKGRFAVEWAKLHPDCNILAVEKDSNVCVDAVELLKSENVTNMRVMKTKAQYLRRILPHGKTDRIYLNFSCPFPKKKYESHRLTYREFLKIYSELLSDNGEIHQKTDNLPFFEYSLESFRENGWTLKNVTYDLHGTDFSGNIMTEYEEKFVSLGKPICRLEAYLEK